MKMKETIATWAKHSKQILLCLDLAGIHDWQDMTTATLHMVRRHMDKRYAPNTCRTFLAELKAAIGKSDATINADYRNILRHKAEKPVKTYLTRDELTKLEKVVLLTDTERGILYTFLISAFSGCRISDATQLTTANVSGKSLTYISQKTSTKSTVPCGQKVLAWITWLENKNFHISLVAYNKMLRGICQRAGIDERVTIYKAGKTIKQEKYKCISSHTGRISFATNLALLHVPILEISQLMGHGSIDMTQRYIAATSINLDKDQLTYFK